MNPYEFNREFQSNPSVTLPAFYDEVRSYHRITEEYDRTVCSGEAYGEAIPLGNEQLALVNQFAFKTKRRIQMGVGITDAEWRLANNYYVKNDLGRDLENDWGRR